MGKLMEEIFKRQSLRKRLAILEKQIYLQQAKEVDLLMREGLSYIAALREVKNMYEKAHSLTDQSIENEHVKLIKDIIADNENSNNVINFEEI